MFRRRITCVRCGNKLDRAFSYCPFCGAKTEKKSSSWLDGPLDFSELGTRLPFSSLFRGIEKHLHEFDQALLPKKTEKTEGKEKPFMRSGGISISISSTGGEPTIRVRPFSFGKPMLKEVRAREVSIEPPTKRLSRLQEERLAKLPKAEPSTKVRRLTDRIIYEIDLPGVQEKDVIISKLQNSIEIKAFTKDKAFFKLIPINLPILKHRLEKGKLILELKPEV